MNLKSLFMGKISKIFQYVVCRLRWLSWMRRPTGDQEVAGSTPAEVSNILSQRLIMKYFLQSFSPLHWFKKGRNQFLVKECAQYWLTACPVNVWLGKLTALDMTPWGWLGRKTLTQTNKSICHLLKFLASVLNIKRHLILSSTLLVWVISLGMLLFDGHFMVQTQTNNDH